MTEFATRMGFCVYILIYIKGWDNTYVCMPGCRYVVDLVIYLRANVILLNSFDHRISKDTLS